MAFPLENEREGEGVGTVGGGGVGTDKGTAKAMCTRLSKRSFSNLPFSVSFIELCRPEHLK